MLLSIAEFLSQHRVALQQSRQRIAFVVHEQDGDTQQACNDFVARAPAEKVLLLSSGLNGGVVPEKATMLLGEEYQLVIVDARDDIHPDALGIVSGVLVGGGCLLILLPQQSIWLSNKDRYKKHLQSLLRAQKNIFYPKNLHELAEISSEFSPQAAIEYEASFPYLTSDQQLAVESLYRGLYQKQEFCALLTSGRGRGKSSSLGLLSAKLMREGQYNILVTAPKSSVCKPLFSQLQALCEEGRMSTSCFSYKKSTISFIAPDALLLQRPHADIIFVDEAAAIPLPMLQQLVEHYPAVVFSTTTHGYEGTGRGFVLKFFKLLDKLRPGWEKVEMHQPIRWAQDDPLEKWIESLLFLDLRLPDKPRLADSLNTCELELVNRDELISDSQSLSSIFSLLVYAHYRTSPSDFRYLLDSNDIRLYVLKCQQQITGVLLLSLEGGFDAQLSTDIYRGQRRPRGHLLAQTLCFHAGEEKAATLKYARIMRIAIHPEVQQQGLGSELLLRVIAEEKARHIDVIGSSFSATAELLAFWEKADMLLLRMGFSRDHVSATHAAVVGQGLSVEGEALINTLSSKFNRNLPLWLEGPLSELAPDLVAKISNDMSDTESSVSQQDLDDVISFALYNRNYDACLPAITRWLNSLKNIQEHLDKNEFEIIQSSMRNKNNWQQIAEDISATGRKQAIALLRDALHHLLINNRILATSA